VLASGTTANNNGGGNTKGEVTLQVDENSAPTRWVVDDPAYLARSGTIGAVTTLTNTKVTVTLIPRVVGTVTFTDTSGTSPVTSGVAGAQVTICPSTATSAPCTDPLFTTSSTGTAGDFFFNGEIPVGTYAVWAKEGTRVGKSTLTVTATTATLSPTAISIATPIATP